MVIDSSMKFDDFEIDEDRCTEDLEEFQASEGMVLRDFDRLVEHDRHY
jgi:hypothetical protein